MIYKLTALGKYPYIHSSKPSRAFAYGIKFEFAEFCGSHRYNYTEQDALHVAKWLNERAQGYPSGPPLLVQLP